LAHERYGRLGGISEVLFKADAVTNMRRAGEGGPKHNIFGFESAAAARCAGNKRFCNVPIDRSRLYQRLHGTEGHQVDFLRQRCRGKIGDE